MDCALSERQELLALQERQEEEKRYALLKIRYRKAERIVFYVEDERGFALESVLADLDSALDLFDRMVKGKLASCHLKDCLTDWNMAE